MASLGASFGNLGLLFMSTSGHSALDPFVCFLIVKRRIFTRVYAIICAAAFV